VSALHGRGANTAVETVEHGARLVVPSSPKGPDRRLRAISHAESSEKTLYVDLDCAFSHANLLSNFLVRIALEQTFENERLSSR
jgi:hypothetical protein